MRQAKTVDYRIGLLKELMDKQSAAAYLQAAAEEDDEGFRMAIRNIAEAWECGTTTTR